MIDIYFLFNKKTQEWIGMSLDPQTISGNVLWRRQQISDKESLTNIKWSGDFSNGKMVRNTEMDAVVTEVDLEDKFYSRFYRKYNIEKFLTILMLQLDKEIDEDNMTEEFKTMKNFFHKSYDKLQEEIEYFKSSEKHEYVSKNDLESRINRQFQV